MNGTQCSQAFGLHFNFSDDPISSLNFLLQDIESQNTHVASGIFGLKFMLPLLSNMQQVDVAFEMINKTDYPSFGYMLENRATTLWEVGEEVHYLPLGLAIQ